jgi:hypothetical protein
MVMGQVDNQFGVIILLINCVHKSIDLKNPIWLLWQIVGLIQMEVNFLLQWYLVHGFRISIRYLVEL